MSATSLFFNYMLVNKTTQIRRNVLNNWKDSEAWRSWESPLDIVRGEPRLQDVLTKLAGPTRKQGYLIPVAVTLRREPSNPYDRHAIKVQISAYSVGYVTPELSEQLSRLFEKSGFPLLLVAGLIRGGSSLAPALEVQLWPSHRLSPGPDLSLRRADKFRVIWPPDRDEGDPTRQGLWNAPCHT